MLEWHLPTVKSLTHMKHCSRASIKHSHDTMQRYVVKIEITRSNVKFATRSHNVIVPHFTQYCINSLCRMPQNCMRVHYSQLSIREQTYTLAIYESTRFHTCPITISILFRIESILFCILTILHAQSFFRIRIKLSTEFKFWTLLNIFINIIVLIKLTNVACMH